MNIVLQPPPRAARLSPYFTMLYAREWHASRHQPTRRRGLPSLRRRLLRFKNQRQQEFLQALRVRRLQLQKLDAHAAIF